MMTTTTESNNALVAYIESKAPTGADFDYEVARSKLLHDCKLKGFSKLRAAGLIQFPEDVNSEEA